MTRESNLLARCRHDPDLFNRLVLRRPPYWARQRQAARAVARTRDVAVYSGNAVGKDYLVAGLILWWLCTRPHSLVVVLGPSQALLGSVTWKELARAVLAARLPLGGKLSKGLRTSPHRLDFGDGWGALGLSTDTVERASGHHARDLLVIAEEASGIPPAVWEAIDGLKYSRLLAVGNPIHSDGPFVDLVRQGQGQGRGDADAASPPAASPPAAAVQAIRIPSTESPHAHLAESPYGLADRTWLEAVARRHGVDSAWYAVHVLALIPESAHGVLIPPRWLDACTAVVRKPGALVDPWLAIDLGLGVGRDSTCLLVRDAMGIVDVVHSNTMGLVEAAEAALRLMKRWRIPPNRLSFDALGVGRDFANHLIRVGLDQANAYAGSGAPREPAYFVNRRAEAAWALRNRLDPTWSPDPRRGAVQAPFHIPNAPWWPRLREESVVLTYEHVGDRQVRIGGKEELRARLGRSPDLADALIQSFAFV